MNAFCASENLDAFIDPILPQPRDMTGKLYLRMIQFSGSRPACWLYL
jgi:hypothetical protein